jgi:hypothetical protein
MLLRHNRPASPIFLFEDIKGNGITPAFNEALHGLKPVVSALRRTPVTLGRFFNLQTYLQFRDQSTP